jgi:hypothetical protein
MRSLRIIQATALIGTLAGAGVAGRPPLAAAAASGAQAAHVHGHIVAVAGNVLTLRLRDGRIEKVDIATARAAHHTGVMPIGGAVIVYGTRDAAGVFHAASIGHTSPSITDWTADD